MPYITQDRREALRHRSTPETEGVVKTLAFQVVLTNQSNGIISIRQY